MLTTTTTTTTTITTTTTAITQAAIYGALGVVILIVLLIAKELLCSYGHESEDEGEGAEAAKGDFMDINTKAKSLATNLSSAIYPLLFCFTLIVIVKVLEVL